MYLAHISEDQKRQQSIKEHLYQTADLAKSFADVFQNGEWGYACGMLHDIGKYSEAFQKRILGLGNRTDHSTAGAQVMKQIKMFPAAYIIAGHHAGLPNGGKGVDAGDRATLFSRLEKKIENCDRYKMEIEIPKAVAPQITPIKKGGFSAAFFIRMVYSCLVDADFLDTENFMKNGDVIRGEFASIEELYDRLISFIRPWLDADNVEEINVRRTEILKNCMNKGDSERGLYSLTVPTGGGKTVASLAFALTHAKKHNMDRVIYVIPYLTISTQTAAVFAKILGKENVLEHHSDVHYEDDDELNIKQLATENWDAPVIITTNVQFFESLFSSRSSKCRKLHNIANSVIIFDEAQMIPNDYLLPCIRAISELVVNYNSTAVLCTATQPSLESLFPDMIKCKEISEEKEMLYDCFKRVVIKDLGMLKEQALIDRLNQHQQVLCIVNSRKSAQHIFSGLDDTGNFHLTTMMYPEHRKRVLIQIREALKAGRPCRVIATSLIEAGVDVDFPVVYRERAGLDSMIQAAGRCNREGGRIKEDSIVYLFDLEREEGEHMPQSLRLPIEISRLVAMDHQDIMSLEAIHEYFTLLHHSKGEGLDKKSIVGQFEEVGIQYLPFSSVDKEFHLIDNREKCVFIPCAESEEMINQLRFGVRTRKLMRDIGYYSVNVYPNYFEVLHDAGALEVLDEELAVLKDSRLYTEECGLDMSLETGDAILFSW